MPSRTREPAATGSVGADRVDDREPRPDRALGIVLMRLRIAEIDQHPVAHVFGDKTVEPADRPRPHGGSRRSALADPPGQTGRQRGRTDHVAEHYGQLPPLGVARRSRAAALAGTGVAKPAIASSNRRR